MTDLHGHAYSALKAQHRAWESGGLAGRDDKRSLSLKELSEKLGPSKLAGKGPRDLEGVLGDLAGMGHVERGAGSGEWQLKQKHKEPDPPWRGGTPVAQAKAPVIDMKSRQRIGAAAG